MGNTATDVLNVARGEIGYSRWTDPETGTKYGRYYAQITGSSYYGENGVPYCAMFVSWVFAQAGASCTGLPEAYCPYILNKAKSAGKVLSNKQNAQPGDVVLFDWGNDGECDHVGIVEKNYGSYIQTIEGNTSSGSSGSQSNGGGVYRRTRSWGTIKAIVRPNYGVSTTPSTGGNASTNTNTSTSTSAKLAVDGYAGKNTIAEWQRQLGCSIVDGVISGQAPENKKYMTNITSVTYEDNGQSGMVKALQRFLTNKGYSLSVDGYIGPKTVMAWQQYMRDYCGYKRHAIDGYFGPNTAANTQNCLNAGFIKM